MDSKPDDMKVEVRLLLESKGKKRQERGGSSKNTGDGNNKNVLYACIKVLH